MSTFRFPFGSVFTAQFIDRPNRFLVRCRTRDFETIEAFMANPGRMWELLLPDVTLYVMEAHARPGTTRKTRYTIVGVERDGEPVFLHTHLNNAVARLFLDEGRIPGLEDAKVIRSEVTVGSSRFDFLLKQGGEEVLLEVKSVTLFGNGVAMFPDAITERGRRHLEELAHLSKGGAKPIVLFLAHSSKVEYFMPDYHTDISFSRTFLAVRDKVRILPVAIHWNNYLEPEGPARLLEIPWDYVERETVDRGVLLLQLYFDKPGTVTVEKSRTYSIDAGYHLFVLHVPDNMEKLCERYKKKSPASTDPLSLVRSKASECVVIPIRASALDACTVAQELSDLFEGSDLEIPTTKCWCDTHAFCSVENPLDRPSFHRVLQDFRMAGPS